jgi:hypothetical protein
MSGSRTHLIAAYSWLGSINAETDRFRDRGLTVLLVLELCLVFLAAPLASDGPPIVRPINETMVLAVVAIVVLLSRRREAIAVIVLGLAAILASALPGLEWPPAAASVLRRGGDILIFFNERGAKARIEFLRDGHAKVTITISRELVAKAITLDWSTGQLFAEAVRVSVPGR